MFGLVSIVAALFIALITLCVWGGNDDVELSTNVIAVAFESASEIEAREWREFHELAVIEYADEFTALFNSYETKWSKNGRLMMRAGNSGSFKFVAKR